MLLLALLKCHARCGHSSTATGVSSVKHTFGNVNVKGCLDQHFDVHELWIQRAVGFSIDELWQWSGFVFFFGGHGSNQHCSCLIFVGRLGFAGWTMALHLELGPIVNEFCVFFEYLVRFGSY